MSMRNVQLIFLSMILIIIKSTSAKPFFIFGFWHEEKKEIVVSWDQAFPNTLWCCGKPIAQNDNAIGEDEVTDECCKIHFKCQNKLPPGGTLENITNNNSNYDLFSCECEEAFRSCLKKSISDSKNEDSSERVGQYYFTTMGDQCFKKEHLIVRCVTENPNPKRCSQYELDLNSEKSYQWFDVFPF